MPNSAKSSINDIKYATPFSTPDDKTYLRKLILISPDGDTEGIWISINPDDVADWKADVRDSGDYTRLAYLCNQSLCGPAWGEFIPYKLNGDGRPFSKISEIMEAGWSRKFPDVTANAIVKDSLENYEAYSGTERNYRRSLIEFVIDFVTDEETLEKAKALLSLES